MTTQEYEALEQQLDVLQFYSSDIAPLAMAGATRSALGAKDAWEIGADAKVRQATEQSARKACEVIKISLERATPYYVAKDIQNMVLASLSSFPDDAVITENDLNTPAGWVFLEDTIPMPLTTGGYDIPLRAFAWYPASIDQEDGTSKAGVVFTFYGPSYKPNAPVPNQDKLQFSGQVGQPFGETIMYSRPAAFAWGNEMEPEKMTRLAKMAEAVRGKQYLVADDGDGYRVEFEDESNADPESVEKLLAVSIRFTKSMRFSMALIHFMNQRIAAIGRSPVPRATRRRIERMKYPPEPIVRTIQLRAREHVPSGGSQGGDPERGISVRYIRRGHWHHYWCGGKSKECLTHGDHTEPRKELRWIDPTVCGPDDAPLKEQAKLFAVVR